MKKIMNEEKIGGKQVAFDVISTLTTFRRGKIIRVLHLQLKGYSTTCEWSYVAQYENLRIAL